MGGNFVARADDASALFWNPAGAAIITDYKMTFGHTLWFADLTHDYFGMVVPWSEGAIGLSVVALNTGEGEVTTIAEPEGTGLTWDVSDLAVGLTYARPLTDRFSVGITGKYINESLYNESASTFAVDNRYAPRRRLQGDANRHVHLQFRGPDETRGKRPDAGRRHQRGRHQRIGDQSLHHRLVASP